MGEMLSLGGTFPQGMSLGGLKKMCDQEKSMEFRRVQQREEHINETIVSRQESQFGKKKYEKRKSKER